MVAGEQAEAPQRRRRDNLLEVSKQVNSNNSGEQGKSDDEGSSMFMFACESDYSLEEPISILDKFSRRRQMKAKSQF